MPTPLCCGLAWPHAFIHPSQAKAHTYTHSSAPAAPRATAHHHPGTDCRHSRKNRRCLLSNSNYNPRLAFAEGTRDKQGITIGRSLSVPASKFIHQKSEWMSQSEGCKQFLPQSSRAEALRSRCREQRPPVCRCPGELHRSSSRNSVQ